MTEIHHMKLEDWSASYSGPKFHAVLCDPPYGLEFMGKDWDAPHKATSTPKAGNIGGFADGNKPSFARQKRHLHKLVDVYESWGTAILPHLHPGALVFMFGGTRTWHHLAVGMEQAGFEMWDTLMWLYGQGFPKAQDISKLIDGKNGTENVVGTKPDRWTGKGNSLNFSTDRPQSECKITEPGSDISSPWSGHKTCALKPAWEPILCFKAPNGGRTYAELAMEFGSGCLNVDGGRIEYRGDVDPRTFGGEWKTDKAANNVYEGGYEGTNQTVSAKGRYPANLILNESNERELVLMYNTPSGTAQAIREYFNGYSPMSGMRSGNYHISEPHQERSQEVLQSEMLRDGPLYSDRKGCSSLRSRTQRSDENRSVSKDEGSEVSTTEQGIQASFEGLCDGSGREPIDGRSKNSQINDDKALRAGAPLGSSQEIRKTTKESRDCAPSQRPEVGQSGRESCDNGCQRSQAGALGDHESRAGVKARESGIEVATLQVWESDVPVGWLKYFQTTGRTVRRGSAAMLDEQTGNRKAGGSVSGIEPSAPTDNCYGEYARVPFDGFGDSGGASRFFYVAKADSDERNAGLYGFDAKVKDADYRQPTGNAMVDRIHGCGVPKKNHHPTVKPISLAKYLATLLLPPQSVSPRRLLIPFAGSGSEIIGAHQAGWDEIVGIEQDEEYVEIAKARVAYWESLGVQTGLFA